MYKFFLSKKGFTLTELMVVATILGILTTISIPIFGAILKKQKLNDCKNNRETIETTVKEAMMGMFDSGAPQKNENNELYINFDRADPSHLSTVEYNGNSVKCFKLEANPENVTENTPAFTLGDLRCGYYEMNQAISDAKTTILYLNQQQPGYIPNNWENYVINLNITNADKTLKSDQEIENIISYQKYKMGCLKSITTKGSDTEVNDGYFLKKSDLKTKAFYTYLDNQEIPVCPFSTEETPYFYYILGDGTVICSCPDCQK